MCHTQRFFFFDKLLICTSYSMHFRRMTLLDIKLKSWDGKLCCYILALTILTSTLQLPSSFQRKQEVLSCSHYRFPRLILCGCPQITSLYACACAYRCPAHIDAQPTSMRRPSSSKSNLQLLKESLWRKQMEHRRCSGVLRSCLSRATIKLRQALQLHPLA